MKAVCDECKKDIIVDSIEDYYYCNGLCCKVCYRERKRRRGERKIICMVCRKEIKVKDLSYTYYPKGLRCNNCYTC